MYPFPRLGGGVRATSRKQETVCVYSSWITQMPCEGGSYLFVSRVKKCVFFFVLFLVLSGKKVKKKKGWEKKPKARLWGARRWSACSPVGGGRLEAPSGSALVPLE